MHQHLDKTDILLEKMFGFCSSKNKDKLVVSIIIRDFFMPYFFCVQPLHLVIYFKR